MQRAIFLPPGGSRPPPLLGSVHVTKLPKDDHGIDGLIADKFRSRGLTVATGPAKPEPLDAVVTCADRWMWDITMYPAIAELPLEDRAGPGSPKLGTSKATDGAFAMNEMTRPAAAAATVTPDRIERVELSLAYLPLATPISDAKVFTGRQKPLTEVAFVFAEITSRDGLRGFGFGYSKRAGGPGMYAHAKEIAPNLIGEDPSDIQKIFDKLVWAGASMGRSGMTVQAIAPFDLALWDLKARRANLPLAKLIGAHRDSVRCYNTSGGFLSTPLPQVLENVTNSRESGIGGIKIKVGHPDAAEDLKRVSAVRRHLGDSFPLMVDANQQWDRPAAMRMCRALEPFGLVWIEEPLDAYDHEGHAALAAAFDAPIATGEMLTSFNEHAQLIEAGACDYVQPDCPRVGGVTQFLRILALADRKGLQLAPHFAMEIHVHLAATYPREPWLEHFDWLEPLFNERLEMRGGRAIVPSRPGIGFSLSDQARAWTVDRATITP